METLVDKLNPQSLAIDFDHAANQLLEIIASFSQKKFNRIPFEGSWTAAQVADHVSKSLAGTTKSLFGQTEVSGRKVDEHVALLRSAFLNFDIKMKSPDFILPDEYPLEKDTLLQRIKESTEKISKAAKTFDLSVLCTNFEMPTLGYLTRCEWITFADVHTQRHIHQLKNIKKKFQETA